MNTCTHHTHKHTYTPTSYTKPRYIYKFTYMHTHIISRDILTY